MTSSSKTVLLLAAFLSVPFAAGAACPPASGRFEWSSSGAPAKVVTGRKTEIGFEFQAPGEVREASFRISAGAERMGIRLVPVKAAVSNGRVSGKVLFLVPRGMPLGRHELTIEAFDQDGCPIGTGTMPFILLPSGSECLC